MTTNEASLFDVAIVGGGVAGLSLARACARVGKRVALFEAAGGQGVWDPTQDWLAGGASSLPVALVNPWRGRKGEAHPDDLAGLAVTRRWADELEQEGFDSGATFEGVLRIPSSARQARMWEERTEEASTLAWLDASQVPEPYHAPFGAMHVLDGGVIHPRRWLTALARSSLNAGALLSTGVHITQFVRTDADQWALEHANGAVCAVANVIVSAVGADPQPVARVGSEEVAWPDWIRTRGEEVRLAGVLDLPHPLAGGIYGAQGAEGDVWIGGGHRDADTDDPNAATNLREAFAWTVPDAAEASIADVWSGVRAKREGSRPDVRAIAEGLWTFGAFAGRGFLCSARQAEMWSANPVRSAETT